MNPEKNGKKKIDLIDRIRSMNRNTLGVIISVAVIILVLVIWLLSRGGASTGSNSQYMGEHSPDEYVLAENDTEPNQEGNSEKTSKDGDSSKNSEKSTSVTSQSGDNSKNKSKEKTKPEDYAQVGDNNLSAVETDAKEGKVWEVLKDEDYGIKIDALDEGYSGPFVEDGSDEKVKKVLALKFTNTGTQDIQYAEYVFGIGKETVSFKLSDLPVGQSCVVLETTQHKYKKKDALSLVTRVVALVDEIPFARDQILVVDNSDNSITVMNLTEKEIPAARVFYKNYDAKQNLFVGGITYNAKVEKIPAGGSITVSPEHFKTGDSVVVGTGVYESDS